MLLSNLFAFLNELLEALVYVLHQLSVNLSFRLELSLSSFNLLLSMLSSPAVFIVIKDASWIAFGHRHGRFRLWLSRTSIGTVLVVVCSLLVASISRIILLISISIILKLSSAPHSNILLDSHASLQVAVLLLSIKVNGLATSRALNFLNEP